MARYEFERMFKTLVVEKGQSEHNNQEIKGRILSQLDAIDASGETRTSRPPFRWAAVALAAAAAIVICIVSAYWAGDYYRYQTEIVPFINAYYTHANGSSNSDYATDPLDYLHQKTGIEIDPDHFPIHLIRSVSVDTIKGVEFGCIELSDPERGKGVVSAFVTRADNYSLPDQFAGRVDGRDMLVHTCEHCSMIGERRGDYIIMVLAAPCCQPKELAQLTAAL